MLNTIKDSVPATDLVTRSTKLWMPQQVMFTPAALDEPWGQQILKRVQSLNLPIILIIGKYTMVDCLTLLVKLLISTVI
ncbi:hypothetical protein LC593_18385 [Nostoc sp. CHAB 5844]|nr:hypothetical protein [Nostoc sp. CHAB 5844]